MRVPVLNDPQGIAIGQFIASQQPIGEIEWEIIDIMMRKASMLKTVLTSLAVSCLLATALPVMAQTDQSALQAQLDRLKAATQKAKGSTDKQQITGVTATISNQPSATQQGTTQQGTTQQSTTQQKTPPLSVPASIKVAAPTRATLGEPEQQQPTTRCTG